MSRSGRRAAAAVVRRHPVPTHQMLGWWDANHGVDQAADAGAVSSWDDKSGNGRTLTQGTAARQPTYRQLGHHGKRSVRGDGAASPNGDVLANTSGAPFHGLAQAAYLLCFSANSTALNRYVMGQAEATAGTNGVDARFINDNTNLRCFTKTDTSSVQLDVGTAFNTIGRAAHLEFGIDLSRASQEVVGVGSTSGFNYTNLGGATLDASGGEFVLFDFSSAGFTAAAAVDFHEVVLVNRPISIGERRRWQRYLVRKWNAHPVTGRWADGTLNVVL